MSREVGSVWSLASMFMPMYKHLIGTAQDCLSRAVRVVFPAPSGPIGATLNIGPILCSLRPVRKPERETQPQGSGANLPCYSAPSLLLRHTTLLRRGLPQWAETNATAAADPGVFRRLQDSCNVETWI